MTRLIYIIFILLFFSNINAYSQQSRLKSRLTTEKFIEIYVEISLLTEQYLNKPDLLNQKKDSLLKKYNITQKEFLDFIDKTDKNPEEYISMWQKIIKKLKTKREALKKK